MTSLHNKIELNWFTRQKEKIPMKSERLIKIIIKLQQGEIVTTRRLADDLEVSERTIHRDMESLSLIGIPVYSERGKNGGWRLVDRWKQSLSYLTEKEIISLFLPTPEKIITELNLDISVEDLKKKLLLSVPEQMKKSATTIWERIYIDTDTWRGSENNKSDLKFVQQAVIEERKIKMQYKKGNGEESTYVLNPLGLVAKGSNWYVVAINSEGEYRNFKMSRTINLCLLEEHFIRPDEFILSNYWRNSKKQFIQALPEYGIEVIISRSIIERITFSGRFARLRQIDNERSDSNWIKAKLSFPTKEEAINFVLGFGNQMKLVEPVELQDELITRAKQVIELYS